jgi:hypothetical protein
MQSSPTITPPPATVAPPSGDDGVPVDHKEQVAKLYQALRVMRHAVNNNVAVIMATAEWIHRHPDQSEKLARVCIEKCPEIVMAIRGFSTVFDDVMKATTRGLRHEQGH